MQQNMSPFNIRYRQNGYNCCLFFVQSQFTLQNHEKDHKQNLFFHVFQQEPRFQVLPLIVNGIISWQRGLMINHLKVNQFQLSIWREVSSLTKNDILRNISMVNANPSHKYRCVNLEVKNLS